MTLEVGLVEGTMPAMTPTGVPMSMTCCSGCSCRTPTARSGRMACQTVSAAKRFLTSLSSGLPKPVSSLAMRPSSWAWAAPAWEMAAQMVSSCSWVNVWSFWAAIFAPATQLRTC